MEFKTKKTDKYASFFLRFRVPFFKKTFSSSIIVYNPPETWVRGYSARTERGEYVLFADYDNLELAAVVSELKFLQKKHGLSDFFIFKTDRDNSFHAVCLDCLSMGEAYSILKETSCDFAFINSIKRLKTREWVLRLTKKGCREAPAYLLTLPAKGARARSSAHSEFLRSIGIKMSRSGKWDGCHKLAIVDYNTSNRVR